MPSFSESIRRESGRYEAVRCPLDKRKWCKARELPDHVQWCRQLNEDETLKYGIYFGANARTQQGGADREHVACYRCVFTDIDDTHDLDEVRRRIRAGRLPEPTLIVDSGHGFHPWWRLSEPIEDLERGERIIEGLTTGELIARISPTFHLTDAGNGERFAMQHEHHLRYVQE